MKHTFILFLMLGICLGTFAQTPSTMGETKVTMAAPANTSNQNDKIHVEPADMHLMPGQDNKVLFTVDGVKSNQLIVKVVSEDLCQGRKGSQFGEYILTPKANEGEVVVRIGQMDFLGAYQKIGEVTFTIGEASAPAEEEKIVTKEVIEEVIEEVIAE
ncbi:MAG: hypothetical protein MJZ67_08225 [Bacteroidales bacterium]|nr:hypothetical protein [Bacteroidales bacterium]